MTNVAICMDCKTNVPYKTKRPKRCKSCKRKHDESQGYFFKGNRPKEKNTKGEKELFAVLDKMLPKESFINHGFYSFIRSPKNSPLQLDRFYPNIRLAFEMNGRTHYEYEEYIHGTYESFLYYQKCDQKKREVCEKQGISLISIDYNEPMTQTAILEKIEEKNPALYRKIKEGIT